MTLSNFKMDVADLDETSFLTFCSLAKTMQGPVLHYDRGLEVVVMWPRGGRGQWCVYMLCQRTEIESKGLFTPSACVCVFLCNLM